MSTERVVQRFNEMHGQEIADIQNLEALLKDTNEEYRTERKLKLK